MADLDSAEMLHDKCILREFEWFSSNIPIESAEMYVTFYIDFISCLNDFFLSQKIQRHSP